MTAITVSFGGQPVNIQVGENTTLAANSAAAALAAKVGAEAAASAAEASALSVGPLAQATLTGTAISAGATFVVDRSILNGATFSRFHARIIGGAGTVVLTALVDGFVSHGPVTVSTAGRTDTISVAVPIGSDLEFSVASVTGAPTAVLIKMQG